jgi:hypothetical protein
MKIKASDIHPLLDADVVQLEPQVVELAVQSLVFAD